MKVRNLNNSSVKTRRLIKNTFITLLAEKKEISKISVSELVARAEISRATFYAHFDDIYSVVEEFEREVIDEFFTNAKLLATDDYEKFFDALLSFMEQNNDNYKMMCKSDDVLFSAKKLTTLTVNKLMELIDNDPHIKNREFIELEISIFLEGLLFEYVKYCRGLSPIDPKELCAYAKSWYKKFMKARC
ncbi:MAG: TetR/AcrR family transcriptional regulator [Clostridiales bacterium]|nr:TetR/AcrR family transcriptional regulator [Clostridiales bacterium]